MSESQSPVRSCTTTPPDPDGRPAGRTGGNPSHAGDLEGLSPLMRQLYVKAAQVAPQETSVLITGETGVGKERLARWLHAHSPRRARAFVAVNCAAFPDTL